MAPPGHKCLGDNLRPCSSRKRRLSFSLSRGSVPRATLPFSDPIMRKHLDHVVLFFQGVFFSPSLSSPFSFRRVSRHTISVPPLTELHSYYPLTSLRFLATLSLALPISPHLAAASHIRLRFRSAPPLSPRAGRPRPRRLCSPAAATLLPSLVLFLSLSLSLSQQ